MSALRAADRAGAGPDTRRRRPRSRCSTAGSSTTTGEAARPGRGPGRAERAPGRAGVRVSELESRAPRPRGDRAGGDARPRQRSRTSDPGRADQAAAPSADMGDDRCAERATHAGRRSSWRSPTSGRVRAPVRRSCRRCSPTARCSRSRRSAIVLPLFLPVAVAVVGRRRDRGRGADGHPALPAGASCRPYPPAGRQAGQRGGVRACWPLAVVAVAAYVEGRLLLGDGPLGATHDASRAPPLTADADDRAHRARVRLRRAVRCSGSPPIALFLSTHDDSPLGRRARARRRPGRLDGAARPRCGRLDRAYLLTRYWLAFVDLFRDPILWHDVIHGVLVQLAYLLVFAARRPGRTSRPRTSTADVLRAAGAAPAPSDAAQVASTTGSPAGRRARSPPSGTGPAP